MANEQKHIKGSNIKGHVRVNGPGDFIGGTKIINQGLSGPEINELIKLYRDQFKCEQLNLEQLRSKLDELRLNTAYLNEWKTVHDNLTNIFTSTDTFSKILREMSFQELRKSDVLCHWRSIKMYINTYRDWAKGVKFIGKPYKETKKGYVGEDWAVHVIQAADTIISLIKINRGESIKASSLRESIIDLENKSLEHLYRVDKRLLETAKSIMEISQEIFRA